MKEALEKLDRKYGRAPLSCVDQEIGHSIDLITNNPVETNDPSK